jgi:hypothetical protein
VAAHAEIADIIKEDDAGGAGGVLRLTEERTYHDVGTSRLVNHGRAETIVFLTEALQPF